MNILKKILRNLNMKNNIKTLFVNDTRTQKNWGCHATSFETEEFIKELDLNIISVMKLNVLHDSTKTTEYCNKMNTDNLDLVIINGEGSIYDSQPKGLNIFKCIKSLHAKKPSLKFLFLNSTYDLSSKQMTERLNECKNLVTLFTAREPVSLRNMKKAGVNNIILQPDFIYQKYKTEELKGIMIGGNSNYYRRDRKTFDAIPAYINLINKLKKITDEQITLYASGHEEVRWLSKISKSTKTKLITVNNTDYRTAHKILASSKLSITGRYHPSIMSLTGSTPCYFVSANNCKMKGTHELFYEDDSNFSNSHDLDKDTDKILNWVQYTLQNYENQISKVSSKLDNIICSLASAKSKIKEIIHEN